MLVIGVINTNILVYRVTRKKLGTCNTCKENTGINIVKSKLYIEYITTSYYYYYREY
jgi:hypothetical protein